ncbi:MAG: type IV secretory system conjugative DNA transfer family protein [Pseudomonadota bacterium]
MGKFFLIVLIGFVANGNCQSIDDVVSGKVLNVNRNQNEARLKAIESIAMSYGIYYGRNRFISEFNESLDELEETLNEFNFSKLLIDENMLPPVIVEADDFYEKEDSTHYRQVHKMYRIVKKASISYNVPSWRNYIYIIEDEDKPTLPSDFKLKGKEEEMTWRNFASKGIQEGRLQANEEVEYQFSKMVRDYKGMVLAHYLNDKHILSFSNLEKFNNGIIVTNTEINIGDTLVNSTDNDKFQRKENWLPLIRLSNEVKGNNDDIYIEVSK